jgi:hypothetical protein
VQGWMKGKCQWTRGPRLTSSWGGSGTLWRGETRDKTRGETEVTPAAEPELAIPDILPAGCHRNGAIRAIGQPIRQDSQVFMAGLMPSCHPDFERIHFGSDFGGKPFS